MTLVPYTCFPSSTEQGLLLNIFYHILKFLSELVVEHALGGGPSIAVVAHV